MNYMPQVMSYLGSTEDITELYITPKAYITEKRDGKLIRVSDTPLTPEDVRDTLVALRSHASSVMGPLGKEGVFSFGVQNIGRFRVNYITQRGSYVIHLTKTPFKIPELDQICTDKEAIKQLDELFRLHKGGGIVVFFGKTHIRASTLIYSLLQHVCNSYNKVIFIIEKPLSFLLKHGLSLVIQMEVGVDVNNFEDGINDALHMSPDILYLGYREVGFRQQADIIAGIADAGTLVLINYPNAEEDIVLRHFGDYVHHVKAFVSIEPSEAGTMNVTIKNTKYMERGNR
ncbi:MAG: ATPase, T2SS/T4P/T4SS family [Aquificaceae bacterium]